jgi:hypothetical protein
MRKVLFLGLIVLLAASFGFAQDMDTEAFVDQIDSGGNNQRGGNLDDGPTPGQGDGDWCFEVLTDGTAGLSGADVNYVNNFAAEYSQGAGEIESPVIDVTSATNQNPDRAWAIPAVAGNTRPGATSPNYAVLVGDDGGYNSLGFGEWDDRNYEVKVDVFLPDHTSTLNNSANEFVRLGMGIRIQQYDGPELDPLFPSWEEISVEGAGWEIRPQGCYSLLYDSSEGNVYPIKILAQADSPDPWDDIRDLSITNASGASPQVAEFLGTGIAVSEGWHTLGIRASGADITFTVDSTTVDVTDYTYVAGKAAVIYRTYSGTVNTSTYDHGGRFDYIRSDPAPTPIPLSVGSPWGLYE